MSCRGLRRLMAAIGVHLGCTSACVAVYKVSLGSCLRVSGQPCYLFSGIRVIGPGTVRASKWQCCGFSALPPRPGTLCGGRMQRAGSWILQGILDVLAALRSFRDEKASSLQGALRRPGHKMPRRVQKKLGLQDAWSPQGGEHRSRKKA